MVEPHDEAVRERALREWASTKYAELITDPVQVYRPANWKGMQGNHMALQVEPYPGDAIFSTSIGGPGLQKINVETEEVRWSRDEACKGFDYRHDEKKIVGRSGANIGEMNATDGSLIRKVTEYGGVGAIGDAIDLCYDRNDPDTYAWVCDRVQHIAGRLNLDTGDLDPYFGEYGTSGSDLSHLDTPRGIFHMADDWVMVTDKLNDRILKIDFTVSPPSVDLIFLIPSPYGIEYLNNPWWKFEIDANNAIVTTDSSQPMSIYINDLTSGRSWESVRGFVPRASNTPTFDYHDPRFVWLTHERSWIRARLDVQRGKHIGNFSWFTKETDKADSTVSLPYNSPPFLGFVQDRMLIRAWSDGSATAYIQVPDLKYRLAWVDTDFSWVDHDSFSITAGESDHYTMTAPLDVFRVRLEGTGPANLQVQGW